MSRKNPLGKIKDVADVAVLTVVGTVTETVKHPIGTGQKVVGTAVGQAAAVVGAVTSRVAGGKSPTQPPTTPAAVPQDEPRKSQGDPVKPAAKKAPAKKAAAKKASAKPTPPPSDTEPLLDPAVTKEVKAEAEIGARASDVDKD